MKTSHGAHLLCVVVFAQLAMPVYAASCSVSASGVALGAYTPNQGAPADSAGRVTIACEKGALDTLPMTVNYSLDLSRGGSSSFSPREMTSGTNKLYYNLYRDAARITIWGDASGGTVTATGALQLQPSPGSASGTHTIYGRIFAGQNAVPGAYADAIVVTVGY